MRIAALVLLSAAALLRAGDPDPVYQAAVGWTTAVVKQDAAGLGRFLADDLQYIHAGGRAQDKAGYIKTVTTGAARYASIALNNVKIVRHGAAAVLTAYMDVKLVNGQAMRAHTLQVYVPNKAGGWQLSAQQATLVEAR